MTFLVIMAAILSTVGVIGLTGTMTINVLESTREIGVMRSIGASHGSIFGIFITEGVVVALMAWAAGALLSLPLSVWLVRALGSAMSLPLAYHFSWAGVGTLAGLGARDRRGREPDPGVERLARQRPRRDLVRVASSQQKPAWAASHTLLVANGLSVSGRLRHDLGSAVQLTRS